MGLGELNNTSLIIDEDHNFIKLSDIICNADMQTCVGGDKAVLQVAG